MHHHWLDVLARQLQSHRSRRGALGLSVGGAGTFLSLGQRAEAACKKVGQKCDKNKDCCNGATCKNGKCKCKSGYDDCDGDGKCKRITNDDATCGACGNVCPAGENCRDGSCETCVPLTPIFEQPPETCRSDAECCGNGLCCTFDDGPGGFITGCYDLLTHTTACGKSCGNVVNCLNSGQICVNGECIDDPAK